MAISIIGTPQHGNATNNGTVTLTFDVAPSTGDVVVFVGGNTQQSTPWNTPGPSTAGYTQVSLHAGSGNAPGLGIWYKVMGATPDTTVTGVGPGNVNEGIAYGAYVLRGVDTSHVEDAVATTAATNDPPSITTVTAGAMVFAVTAIANNTDNTPGTITGYSSTITDGAVETNRYYFAAAVKTVSPAGAENPAVWSGWSGTIATFYSITWAVRPTTTTTVAVARASENDIGRPITPLRTRAIGQATVSNAAQAFTHLKTRTIGQATETNPLPPPVRPLRTRAIGQAIGTQAAQSVTPLRIRSIARAFENDIPFSVTPRRARAFGQTTENDAAQAIAPLKGKAVGQATETDHPLTADFAWHIRPVRTKPLSQATETDTPGGVVPARLLAIARTFENDIGRPITPLRFRALGQAIDVELGMAFGAGKTKAIGQALDLQHPNPFDTAWRIRPVRLYPFGQADEVDVAMLIEPGVARHILVLIEGPDGLWEVVGPMSTIDIGESPTLWATMLART